MSGVCARFDNTRFVITTKQPQMMISCKLCTTKIRHTQKNCSVYMDYFQCMKSIDFHTKLTLYAKDLLQDQNSVLYNRINNCSPYKTDTICQTFCLKIDFGSVINCFLYKTKTICQIISFIMKISSVETQGIKSIDLHTKLTLHAKDSASR